ncbi:hypothetical protein F5Y19DRAFT_70884 [Xylariaceae sp. FL1651]|nr:hypothetical protein F5Y19DRAFT_70884 [Xylariaceae sp. FL1651]
MLSCVFHMLQALPSLLRASYIDRTVPLNPPSQWFGQLLVAAYLHSTLEGPHRHYLRSADIFDLLCLIRPHCLRSVSHYQSEPDEQQPTCSANPIIQVLDIYLPVYLPYSPP